MLHQMKRPSDGAQCRQSFIVFLLQYFGGNFCVEHSDNILVCVCQLLLYLQHLLRLM